MLLKTATWQEVEAYLKHSDGIMIPIGSTEQHGPTGLLGTDALCPEIIAEHISEQQNDIMVAPTVNFGVAQHHLGFAGTIAMRPTTFMAVLYDIVNSLAVHGFKHLYFLNGHGGNIAPVETLFAEIYSESSFQKNTLFSDIHCKQLSWWTIAGISKLSQQLHGEHEGFHATPAEIAITNYAYPDSIKTAKLDPKVAPTNDYFYDTDDFRKRFPDGRAASDPSAATAETGKQILATAVSNITKDYLEFLSR